MGEETLKRIADSLERIAICMENKQLREIATYKKSQIAEKKEAAKKQPIVRALPEKKQTIRVRTSNSK
jgi:hypothetical protein